VRASRHVGLTGGQSLSSKGLSPGSLNATRHVVRTRKRAGDLWETICACGWSQCGESSAETSGLGVSHVRSIQDAASQEAKRKTSRAQRDVSLVVLPPLPTPAAMSPTQPSRIVSSRGKVTEAPPSPKAAAAHNCTVVGAGGGLWVVSCGACQWRSQPMPKHAIERTVTLHNASGDRPRPAIGAV